ncbi:carbohydrate kinase family protein [Kineococcus sp. SYSU DK018]|uniref:carbohydrate kinase family protein n=1 Tax=Kineococcus sp. SYSU DK018 TaxID=3383139 RepID=UPI003D7E3C8D
MSTSAVDVDVVFGGSIFCDLIMAGTPLPQPGEEVYAHSFAMVAGGTANRAVAAARLGMSTGVLAVLGTDVLGDHMYELLVREERLDLRWLQRAAAQTPVTVAVTNEHDRGFITYEEANTQAPSHWPGPLPQARVCHTGISSALPVWAADLRRAGTTVFGGVGWDETGQWSNAVLRHIEDIDVFVLNEVEALNYTRTDSVDDAAKLLTKHVQTVVITRGGAGVTAVDGGDGTWVHVPAVRVRAVDPTGAGDVFTAGLMSASVLGWDLHTRVAFAGLAATLSVRSLGGSSSAPRPDEIATYLTSERPEGDWSVVMDWARQGALSV